jgi:hypothetical protein
MRRSLRLLCLALAVSLVHVSLASACMNDSITFRVEQEFKTNYERKTNSEFKSNYQDQSPSSPSPKLDPKGPLATLAGIGLLLGAVGLATASLRGRHS